jgi:hypothetical protein
MASDIYAAFLGARRHFAALMPSAEAQPQMARTAALAAVDGLPSLDRARSPELAGICVQLVRICARRAPDDPALTKLVIGGLSVFDAFLKVEAGETPAPPRAMFEAEGAKDFLKRLRGGGHG